MFNPKKAMKIRTEPLSELDYKKIKDVFESALFMLDLLMFCNILSVILLRLKTYTEIWSDSRRICVNIRRIKTNIGLSYWKEKGWGRNYFVKI